MSARVLLRLVQLHGAAPSAVLRKCGILLERIVNLFLSLRADVRAGGQLALVLNIDLLELLAEIADEQFAPQICSPPLLEALKPLMLSGVAALQLAVVDCLVALQRSFARRMNPTLYHTTAPQCDAA